ncbi:MAG: AMP-binding protein [Burkholderiaceae bacterium]|jgi:long-chain acyl-CoA synthetase|nr:AMP-binding protein [Burkholderiaceae bacterium]
MEETLDPIDNLARWAALTPDKTAVYFANGEAVTTLSFAELEARANIYAHWLTAQGFAQEDVLALLMENRLDLLAIAWGARRAGLYYVPVNTHLQSEEIAYILNDCGARTVIATPKTTPLMPAAQDWAGQRYQLTDGAAPAPGFTAIEPLLAAVDARAPLPQRKVGRDFLYSSGTTGRPKGIKRPLTAYADRFKDGYEAVLWREFFGFGQDTVYLTMAPLYHAAPLRSVMRNIEWGGSSIIASRFDAALALSLIERYRATHSQWVPTMMFRMLSLPDAVRRKADVSSMKVAIHAAAPCPPDVKRRMIAWWGPVWYEYYGGSEGIGLTATRSTDWLGRPGTVGRALLGQVHIKDDQGQELPTGQQGYIWFSGTPRFVYHNAPEKTAAAYDASGCATFGDLGHIDAEGYLYLSGRRTDLILSGGVNIYPQEIENLLATYPGVTDVAVIGIPHPEYGQEVKAVVQLEDPAQGSSALEHAIIEHCRVHLAHFKCPHSIDFVTELPRQENGKIYKRLLLNRYA